jgi:hypothetical protein
MYDLAEDPYELTNLIDDPNRLELRKRMEAGFARWQRENGDKLPGTDESLNVR